MRSCNPIAAVAFHRIFRYKTHAKQPKCNTFRVTSSFHGGCCIGYLLGFMDPNVYSFAKQAVCPHFVN